MLTPLSLSLDCPHCHHTNSVPGFSYGPGESLICFHCGDLFTVGQCRVEEVLQLPRVEPAEQLQDFDIRACL